VEKLRIVHINSFLLDFSKSPKGIRLDLKKSAATEGLSINEVGLKYIGERAKGMSRKERYRLFCPSAESDELLHESAYIFRIKFVGRVCQSDGKIGWISVIGRDQIMSKARQLCW